MNFVQRVPDGACLTLETLMRSVLPVNTMAIAMGLHARCGNEDTIWGRKGEKMTSVQQIDRTRSPARRDWHQADGNPAQRTRAHGRSLRPADHL